MCIMYIIMYIPNVNIVYYNVNMYTRLGRIFGVYYYYYYFIIGSASNIM